MARLNVLEYTADFVRGWPHGSASDMNYNSAVKMGNGDIVKMAANGTVVPATGVAGETFGMVARGVKDTFNEMGAGRGNLYNLTAPNIVLWSSFVVRTSNVDASNVPSVIGGPVYVNADSNLTSVAGTSEVFGTLLEVETGVQDANGNTVNAIVVLVK